MKTMSRLLAATMFVAGLAGAAHAKTFVYCSESSPEGFDPAPYAGGNTFDASSKPVYNRLTEFERGTTNGGMLYTDNFLSWVELTALPRAPVDPDLLNPPVVRALPLAASHSAARRTMCSVVL